MLPLRWTVEKGFLLHLVLRCCKKYIFLMHFFGSDENRKYHNTDLDKSGECLQRYYIIRTNKK